MYMCMHVCNYVCIVSILFLSVCSNILIWFNNVINGRKIGLSWVLFFGILFYITCLVEANRTSFYLFIYSALVCRFINIFHMLYPCIYPLAYVCMYVSICVFMYVCMSFYLLTYLTIYLSIYLPIHLSIYTYLSIFICVFTRLYIYLYLLF